MKLKTFKFNHSGSYITVFQREGEDWKFDLNFFEGERSIEELEDLQKLIKQAFNYIDNV